jgi:hypothetical protein
MNSLSKLGFILIALPLLTCAASNSHEDSWACKAHDEAHNEWTANNAYQKVALNRAFDDCKKQSESPTSCTISEGDCEGFLRGVRTKTLWRCTASDRATQSWKSNYYSNKEDAAQAAKDFCQKYSGLPESCFVSFAGCISAPQG